MSPEHLKRYIGEFDFRYSNGEINDAERRDVALQRIEGDSLSISKNLCSLTKTDKPQK